MRTLIPITVISATIWVLYPRESDEWPATVCPSSADLSDWIHVGVFESLDMCRIAARQHLVSSGNLDSGTYECGLNCQTSQNDMD